MKLFNSIQKDNNNNSDFFIFIIIMFLYVNYNGHLNFNNNLLMIDHFLNDYFVLFY